MTGFDPLCGDAEEEQKEEHTTKSVNVTFTAINCFCQYVLHASHVEEEEE